jgi:hypothetical protein
MAIAADGSKEGASLPCCSLWRVDEAGSVKVGLGVAWRGKVLTADGSTGAFRLLCCSL